MGRIWAGLLALTAAGGGGALFAAMLWPSVRLPLVWLAIVSIILLSTFALRQFRRHIILVRLRDHCLQIGPHTRLCSPIEHRYGLLTHPSPGRRRALRLIIEAEGQRWIFDERIPDSLPDEALPPALSGDEADSPADFTSVALFPGPLWTLVLVLHGDTPPSQHSR